MRQVLILWCSLLFNSAWAQESEWNKAFNVIWESRWQQTGIPMRAVRWHSESKSIQFSINKAASSSNANRSREAINVITKVLDWKAIEVDEGSPDAQIEITIRHYKEDELRYAVCHASPTWQNWLYTKQKLSLSEQHAYRCVLHELMHAFGFPGHPQGDTVLSYFEGNQSSLKPMDEFLLKAWYSHDIKVGASPFITANELTQQWVLKHVPVDQQTQAVAAQTRWFHNMIKTMEDFALNKGEPPTILYRSGRLSEDSVRAGLLLMGAQAGNSGAAGILARQLKANTWQSTEAKPLCEWLSNTSTAANKINADVHKAALESKTCKSALN